MSPSFQVDGAPENDIWRQVIDLGARIVELHPQDKSSTAQAVFSQGRLIKETTSKLVGGKTSLHFSRNVTRLFVDQSEFAGEGTKSVLDEFGMLTPLMRLSLDTGEISYRTNSPEDQQHTAEHLPDLKDIVGIQSIAIPLAESARNTPEKCILGILQVDKTAESPFTFALAELAVGIATQVSLALQASLSIARNNWLQEQLGLVQQVSVRIAEMHNLDELTQSLASLIQETFGYYYVSIFTLEADQQILFHRASAGLNLTDEEWEVENTRNLDVDLGQGIVGFVAQNGTELIANDVSREARYRKVFAHSQTSAEAAFPLEKENQVFGVLDVQSQVPEFFTDIDLHVLRLLANSIAIALHNARLLSTEIWRRHVAEGMRQVIAMLSADVDLASVLDAILVELEHTLPLDVAAIWLADEVHIPEGDSQPPVLRLSAAHGDSLPELDLEIGSTPAEIFSSNQPLLDKNSSLVTALEKSSAWLEAAFHVNQPVIRSTEFSTDPLSLVLNFPIDHSAIAVPLRVGNQGFGLLTLSHRDPRRYGKEAQLIAETFGNYAAVAIENTRVFEAAYEQAWISSVLLQVAEATQEYTELNELLQTVIQIPPSLTGVKACLLYLTDEDQNFIPVTASGLDAQGQNEFELRRFTAREITALDRMVSYKSPQILTWEDGNLPLLKIIHLIDSSTIPERMGISVLVPMLSRGEVLGAIAVAYQPESLGEARQKQLDSDLAERLAIIQGIAHQTAIAVENLRLIGAQKAEAYASVALLQVAQTVVSSADLTEALSAIVRITPILIGVNRASIFLWNQSNQVYTSVQSYGTSRDSDIFEYNHGIFPLLDAVVESNRLVAYPLPADRDIFKDAPDDWIFLIPPDLEEVDSFLVESERLLLATPLSVKGEVFGVLVVEEPKPYQPGELLSKSNRRLRSRRLEILTGVSQQSALAIQNDVLKDEMVERERMERELQLARQIQRTFLPDFIPDFAGWDLQVCWRTAREVSGDFYDFFELPEDRLGLVIADVADKGMPAALFMTVVRSLVRASLEGGPSPGAVLERVNNLIVPDATDGMFITITFAVLDLQSGVLTYANAGHNPPFLVRKSSYEIEILPRGGMALGVLKDSQVQEGQITLEPGDFLVMYTDGVTEAFSPQGDAFGEEALYATIIDALVTAVPGLDKSAEYLVQAIDHRVSEFIGNSPRSDDLTLLVLKRMSSR